jgi:hypothetical protein
MLYELYLNKSIFKKESPPENVTTTSEKAPINLKHSSEKIQ